jgi:FeS assembly SUF system protein
VDLMKLFRNGKKEEPKPGNSPPADSPIRNEPQGGPVTEEQVIEAMRGVYDPEIPVNIYELGLIYRIDMDPAGQVLIQMTLTSPGCPVAASMPMEVENRVLAIPGVRSVFVDLVWDPPWTPERMSEAAKLELGIT